MLLYYLKFAFRNFLRNKVYSFINIFGLSIGMAAAFLILLWVQREYSVNRFHEKINSLYRVMWEENFHDGVVEIKETTPAYLGRALLEKFPEVVNANTRTFENNMLIRHDTAAFKGIVIFSDPSLFSMFSFPMVEGSFESMNADMFSAVISEKLAAKLFSGEKPVGGHLIVVDGNYHEIQLKVCGVFRDIPEISTITAELIIPFATYLKMNEWTQNWGNKSFLTTVELMPGANEASFNEKMTSILYKEHDVENSQLFVQRFGDSYLKSVFGKNRYAYGRNIALKIFIVIAIFTLGIACFNFMNLSTAQASKRMREIGVKKVVGVSRKNLIVQFLGESVILALVSSLISIIMAELAIPLFNSQVGYQIRVPYDNPVFLAILIGTGITTGLFSGSYPSLYLSSITPAQVIKGSLKSGPGRFGIRELLVIFQFMISIFLIICTSVLYNQLQFILNKNIGLERESVIKLPIYEGIGKHQEAFKRELQAGGNVISASYSSQVPFSVGSSTTDPRWGGKPQDSQISFDIILTDYDFIRTMGMQIIAGRDFSWDHSADSSGFIINEEALKVMGFKDPIGEPLSFWGVDGNIIGVVRDFHNRSIHLPIEPVIIAFYPEECENIFIKLNNNPIQGTLKQLESLYRKFEPGYPLEYTFLDEAFQRQYAVDRQIGRFSLYFSCLSVLIACLGLFGLSSYAIEQRIREIGVRKVFGASMGRLTLMLTGNFSRLVLISFLLAVPGIYFLMKAYLDSYAYKIELNIWYFIGGGSLAVIISTLTVSYQAIRGASKNPVEILKHE
ncbi:MAG TPA: FtsX-like permease family protein [Cyclobacteriaceae bacterium]|nr:FtsX-like permease family protein [Cyclobacteriaceae bacterium]